jgi:hypothetical protein
VVRRGPAGEATTSLEHSGSSEGWMRWWYVCKTTVPKVFVAVVRPEDARRLECDAQVSGNDDDDDSKEWDSNRSAEPAQSV